MFCNRLDNVIERGNIWHLHIYMSIQSTVCWMVPIRLQSMCNRSQGTGNEQLAAITDHGVMYGVIDFYRAAKEAGINPILGCEVYVAPGSRFDRETGQRRRPLLSSGAAGGK